jgi:hypothetical protein
MSFGLDGGPAEAAVSLEIAVNPARLRVWFFLGVPGEGRAWLERGLDAVEPGESADRPRTAATGLSGWISLCQGDPDSALESLRSCRAGPDADHPDVHFLEGAYAVIVDSDACAIATLERALRRHRAVNSGESDTAMIELFMAMSAAFFDDTELALELSERPLANAERQGAARQITWAQWAVGLAAAARGPRACVVGDPRVDPAPT